VSDKIDHLGNMRKFIFKLLFYTILCLFLVIIPAGGIFMLFTEDMAGAFTITAHILSILICFFLE
jgi:hypothetical protein